MTTATFEVTRAGIYPNMPPEVYHGDPVPGGSLSSGGARKLLPPSCPAKFRHWLDHGDPASRVCEFGNAAHLVALGAGTPVAVIDADNWRTNAAKEQRDEARAEGLNPILVEEWERVQDMATALRADPTAGAFFEPGSGVAEQSLFWHDPEFNLWRRARLDWAPNWFYPDGRFVLVDYKTCASADPDRLQKTVVDHGYGEQLDWYGEGATALGMAPKGIAPVLVFQEKTPPYVCTTLMPDVVVMERGRARNRLAMSIYRDCMATGVWPGYVEGVGTLELPRWVEVAFADEVEHGVYDVLGKGADQ